MFNESTLNKSTVDRLVSAVKRNGGTIEDLEYLCIGDNFRIVSVLRREKAKLIEIEAEQSQGLVVPVLLTPGKWVSDASGNIHLVVISDGKTPDMWKEHFISRGLNVSPFTMDLLRCVTKDPTNGVHYHVVLRPGYKIKFWSRTTKKIRKFAETMGWKTPHWEVACLIFDTLPDKQLEELGLFWITTMHEPIRNWEGSSYLNITRENYALNFDFTFYRNQKKQRWGEKGGFAFVVPPVSTQLQSTTDSSESEEFTEMIWS